MFTINIAQQQIELTGIFEVEVIDDAHVYGLLNCSLADCAAIDETTPSPIPLCVCVVILASAYS